MPDARLFDEPLPPPPHPPRSCLAFPAWLKALPHFWCMQTLPFFWSNLSPKDDASTWDRPSSRDRAWDLSQAGGALCFPNITMAPSSPSAPEVPDPPPSLQQYPPLRTTHHFDPLPATTARLCKGHDGGDRPATLAFLQAGFPQATVVCVSAVPARGLVLQECTEQNPPALHPEPGSVT